MTTAATVVIRRLRECGYEAFLVGGCVRDLLLQRTPKDFDVTTNARPRDVQDIFEHTIPVGASFGVVVVVMDGEQVEVATYRSDGQYSDGRRPDSVSYGDSAKADVTRRDFTINGLLCVGQADPENVTSYNASLLGATDRVTVGGETYGIVDHVGGLADVQRGVIRCIGKAEDRFAEDALRMLRAVRFAAQLGFDIERHTFLAIAANAPSIRNVSKERVTQELFKLLTAPFPVKGIVPLFTTGLARFIFPEGFISEFNLGYTLQRFEEFQTKSPVRALTMFLSDLRSSRFLMTTVKEALRLSNDEQERVVTGWMYVIPVVKTRMMKFTPADIKRTLRQPGIENTLAIIEQDRIIGKSKSESAYESVSDGDINSILIEYRCMGPSEVNPEPFLTGNDLIAAGLTPSPIFKDILLEAETEQLNGVVTDRETALAAIPRYKEVATRV